MKLLCVSLLVMFFSLPASASSESVTLEVSLLEENIYLHRSYKTIDGFGRVASNGLIVIDNNKAYMIDTPWSESDTGALVNWVKDKGYALVASISTHSHEDRAGGIGVLNHLQVDTYASVMTNQLLIGKQLATATNSFSEDNFVMVPDLIEAYYPGAGHTKDNLVVWLPKSKILFGGCLVRALNGKTLGFVGEAAIDQWEGSIDKLIESYPQARRVVPGHGDVGNVNLLKHTKFLANKAHSN